jgi:sec-independent protein translocase protein TatA
MQSDGKPEAQTPPATPIASERADSPGPAPHTEPSDKHPA